jgi:hypothetical protein
MDLAAPGELAGCDISLWEIAMPVAPGLIRS